MKHRAAVKYRSLARVMSKQGICSRKEAARWIAAKKVKVNGIVADSPEMLVPLNAKIELIGIEMPPKQTLRYVVMNKRRGVVTTCADELGRATVYDDLQAFLIANAIPERLFAVGRLDMDTAGLLLFTNDNDLANFLTFPENNIPKTYLATLNKPLTIDALKKLESGVEIKVRGQHYFATPRQICPRSSYEVELTLTEGKNREVRRLFQAMGYRVETLLRIGFAALRLDISARPPLLNGRPLEFGTCTECSREEVLGNFTKF
ncbi:MAG: pseudouridine synthase [Chloroherpetonaceae bacterium]|nr:pseudouridine synthase [Chloroherpetonaceae bacterium]MDW8019272.1 pseudouridine synthase [Chloroherpetonaceae bacterium]MDW8466062.1 pseudouridine synthase [Chloroherpetonaceae bacterium]